jgi:DNA-binding LytR/AlgR family response regulator
VINVYLLNPHLTMTLKCLIADDEPLAHTLLENYIGRLKTLSVAGHAYNAFEVLDFLGENEVDILFLDINMPDMTGLDMLKTLAHPPIVILTTAYSEHSLEAFDLGVMDYLLKPIKFDRFLKAVNRVIDLKKPVHTPPSVPIESGFHSSSIFSHETPERLENNHGNKPERLENNHGNKSERLENNHSNFIFIKDGTTNYKVNFDELLYVQAYGNFAKVFTTKQTIVASITMKHLEEELPESSFTRVHKSYIINIQKVSKIEGNTVFIGKIEIPVGAVYKMGLDKKVKG